MERSWAWDADIVEVVDRRADLMAALETSRRKRDLVAELDVSRSTLDRAMRELETLGLVARDDGYHLTQTGRLVLELFDGFLADLEDVAAARELLRPLPPDAPMSPVLLRDATVEVATPPTPVTALEPVNEVLADCDRVRGLSVAASRPNAVLDLFAERVEAGARFEWVLSAEMAAYLREHHREQVADLRATGRLDLYRVDDLPYGMGVVTAGDRHYTFLVAYDDDHAVRGTVVNEGLEAYGWGEEVYRSYREDAEPLAPL